MSSVAESLATAPFPADGVHPRDLLTSEDCRQMLFQLYLARYFDVRLIKEKKRGHLRGTLYSSHNQEAVLVGSLYGLEPNDWISPIHRDMPAFFLKDARSGLRNPARMGMSIQEVCAQIWGKSGSPGRARDNWSHIGSRAKRIIHSTSMLASTIPVAAGIAYAEKLNGGSSIVLTFNGEGSTARGDFHEGMNFAAVHKLPLVSVIENNQWAYGTPVELGSPSPDIADRAKGYGIPGLVADGQDVHDVYDKVKWCIDYARAGHGPSIVECKTYRAYGHGDHDDDRANQYRSPEDIAQGRARDPIAIVKKALIEHGCEDAEILEKYCPEGKSASEVRDEDFPPEVVEYLREGVQYAMKSPYPEPEEAAMWVYHEEEE